MPQSLARIAVHLVFSTKNRAPCLKQSEVRDELIKYMATIFQGIESLAIEINCVEDHVHALFCLSRKHALAAVVEEVKTETSKWIKRRLPNLAAFHWQAGYGAFSVSKSKVDKV